MDKDKLKNIVKNNYFKYAIILILGVFLGWVVFGGSAAGHQHDTDATTDKGKDEKQVWTCSMHPQIKQNKPGKCPICGMDLILLRTAGGSEEVIDPNAIQLSEEAAALANVQTTVVSRQNPVKDVQLYGTIQADERLLQSQTSHVSGRLEKLYINFTGESVRQGQTIAKIYSPDLLNAQQELLEAVKMQDQQPQLLVAAREKLRLWKLSDSQIEKIEQSGNASALIEIKANTSGIVVSKNVSQGDYINQGSILFDIANLSKVWAIFDAYEVDLPFLKVGDHIKFTLQALPGKSFSGRISFINPILDKTSRTAKVRVEVVNKGFELKPEMYASADIQAPLKQYANELVIPKSAVLWTGKRSVVYVKQQDANAPVFMLREIELGPSLGDSYVILSGLNDGDEIVTNGVFTVDASAQLEGKRSMMNMELGGEKHQHNMVDNSNAKHEMLKVEGLCEMCKERIEKAAKGVDGVLSASWDQKTKQLHLNLDSSKTSVRSISKAVAKVGHDTERDKASDEVYNNLPACCLYRK